MTTATELSGLEGLKAALECPEDWEALCFDAHPAGPWEQSSAWMTWSPETIARHVCKFRRIVKPREAMLLDRRIDNLSSVSITFPGNSAGQGFNVSLWLPVAWLGKSAQLNIREIPPDAQPEPATEHTCQRAKNVSYVTLSVELESTRRQLDAERAAHEETRNTKTHQLMDANDRYLAALSRAESAEAKLEELHAAATRFISGATIPVAYGPYDHLMSALKRCEPEGKSND
jgi:hypothetical protein